MVSRLTGICHVNLASGYSGGERQTELLVRELAERGVPQRLVVRAESGLAERCGDFPGIDVRIVAGNQLAAARALNGCSVVNSHDGRSVYAALLAYWLFRIPYVATRRVVPNKPIKGMRRVAYNSAARVVAVSGASADNLRAHGLSRSVDVIEDAHSELPVDKGQVSAIRNARAGKLLIGHAGTLDDSHKGQSTIIEAAHRVGAEHPDWHFMLCGEGKDRQRFEEEIGALANVEIVGWVDNIGDYLAAFDLFVFPSRHEALGSTLLDALHVGLPIAASNVGGIPGVVEDGVNGRLFEPGDAEGLVAAVEVLLSDEQELAAMRARNARKSELFDATRMADAYETLYREITGQV